MKHWLTAKKIKFTSNFFKTGKKEKIQQKVFKVEADKQFRDFKHIYG